MGGRRALFLISFLLLGVTGGTVEGFGEPGLEEWRKYAVSGEGGKILSWARETIIKELDPGSSLRKAAPGSEFPRNHPPFFGRLGIFVTLLKEGRVRGCYGAFHHRSDDLRSVLTSYIRGALRYDPRYKPLGIEEGGEADIIITIASQPLMVNSIYSVDISRYGIIISLENGTSLLFVPSEIKTHDYLKRRLGRRKTTGVSAFRAVTIKMSGGEPR